MFQPLTTTVATPVVGAVKVGYELNALGDVGYNPPSPYSYPPTVVPLNTQHLMDSTSSDTYQGKSGGLWSFSDRYKASMAAKNMQRSGVSNNWAAIPFTPSCTRTYEGNVNAFALPDTPYSCTEQPTSDTVARRTGRNAQGYKVELTADRTCLDQGIPLDQCLEYGESNAYSFYKNVGEGREGREGRKPWVWGVSEGCLYGANGCQGPYHSEYAAMPYVDTTSITSTGHDLHAYTLPPANYPGYNPPKGQYSLRFTALVVRVEFAAVVGDSTRVEVQEWLTGTGKYAGVEGKGALRNSLVFDVLQHETQQYGWFVFAMGMTCFTVVFVLAALQCIEECQIYGSRGGGPSGGTGGTGALGAMGILGATMTVVAIATTVTGTARIVRIVTFTTMAAAVVIPVTTAVTAAAATIATIVVMGAAIAIAKRAAVVAATTWVATIPIVAKGAMATVAATMCCASRATAVPTGVARAAKVAIATAANCVATNAPAVCVAGAKTCSKDVVTVWAAVAVVANNAAGASVKGVGIVSTVAAKVWVVVAKPVAIAWAVVAIAAIVAGAIVAGAIVRVEDEDETETI